MTTSFSNRALTVMIDRMLLGEVGASLVMVAFVLAPRFPQALAWALLLVLVTMAAVSSLLCPSPGGTSSRAGSETGPRRYGAVP